ncbi:MAG: LysE family translocator [Prevotellaceae bacterium]|jgi:threonine/homoserine/homoserine lactone efflux protein|nr:LysE family translocator [Prevotellaceae bacterium]
MDIGFFKGILVGLGASIPLGPIGVLVVQRTISKGRNSGFISGLGAATADTIFAALAVLSLAFVQRIFDANETFFLIFGGLLVAAIGLSVYLTNPIKQLRRKRSVTHSFEDYISVFLLTLSNPGATFLMLALFALVGVDVDQQSGALNIVIVLWGVVIGAAAWWFFLSWLISHFRQRFRIRQLWYINRIAGIVIMVLGIISVFGGLERLLLPLLH